MKTMRSLLVILCICCTCFSSKVSAKEDVYTENYFQYTIQDESITMIGYYGNESEITVPAMIASYPVNTIASGAFADCSSVKKINLPDTIMSIEEGAFSGAQTVVLFSNKNNAQEYQPQNPQITTIINPEAQENPSNTESSVQSGGTTVQDPASGETYEVEERDDTSDFSEKEAQSKAAKDDAKDDAEDSKKNKTVNQTGSKKGIAVGAILVIFVCVGGAVGFVYHRKRTKKK